MEKLREIRIAHGYSFGYMAEQIGISKPFYWQLEHNQRRLSYDLAIRIAKVFDLKPDEIFYDEMKQHKNFLKDVHNQRNRPVRKEMEIK